MTLSEFISIHLEEVITEWESFTLQLVPQSRFLSPEELHDHHKGILVAIAAEMLVPESRQEQIARSKNEGKHSLREYGKRHATQRLNVGFGITQLVAEYRALRSTVIRMWNDRGLDKMNAATRLYEVTRFDEAIDEVLSESVNEYSETVNRHRAELIGILGHDLRNPLAAIIMGAQVLTGDETLDDKQVRIAGRIINSAKRMNRMVGYLLDLIRIKQGTNLPIFPASIDIGGLFQQIIAELQMVYPQRVINFDHEGDLRVKWDEDRMAQVISNIIGNALQHGSGSVDVIVRATNGDIIVQITNTGPVIPAHLLGSIFDPMVSASDEHRFGLGLGLGLHIARKIIQAHQGKITVTSTKKNGTTFTIFMPRYCSPSMPPVAAVK